MSRSPIDPTTKILELFLDVPHAERAMLVKFLTAIVKDQARDVEPTDREAATERKAAKKRAAKTFTGTNEPDYTK